MPFELKTWQMAINQLIEEHDAIAGSEKMQTMQEYDRNNESAIRVHLPRGSGHSTFAVWLYSNRPTLLIYTTHMHMSMLDGIMKEWDFKTHTNSQAISAYEIFYAIQENGRSVPSAHFQDLKNRFQTNPPELIVIDMSSKIPPIVIDFILQIASDVSTIVMLG